MPPSASWLLTLFGAGVVVAGLRDLLAARKGLRWAAWVENQPHWFVIDRNGTLTFMLEQMFVTPSGYEWDVDLVGDAW